MLRIKDYEKKVNITLQKETNKSLITDPEKWRSMNCQTKSSEQFFKEVLCTTRTHRQTTEGNENNA